MAHYKALVRIGMDSGIPEDAVVNTFHADCLVLPNGYEDFVDALEGMYQILDSSLSSRVDPSAVTCKVYKMSDPEPRAPVYEKTFTGLTTGTTAEIPEVALCLSFQGARESGESQARRRGRVYIGPLGQAHISSTDPGVYSGLISNLASAGQFLLDASELSTEWTWCVYSVRDNALVPVTNGWVDNAWDIQRRRGTAPTSRTTFS